MLVVNPNTAAQCERSFSQMHIIKANLRNSLKQKTLKSLMFIKMEGPTLAEFEPRLSVEKCLKTGGTKHLHGHKLKNNTQLQTELQAAAAKNCYHIRGVWVYGV
jgi:hypothetical protein